MRNQGNSSADDKPSTSFSQKTSGSMALTAPKKKSSLCLRIVSSVFLISFMCLCYAGGHLYYSLFLLYSGWKCYFELIALNRNPDKDKKNALSTTIDWYAPFIFTFYLIPKTFVRRILIDNDSIIDFK